MIVLVEYKLEKVELIRIVFLLHRRHSYLEIVKDHLVELHCRTKAD